VPLRSAFTLVRDGLMPVPPGFPPPPGSESRIGHGNLSRGPPEHRAGGAITVESEIGHGTTFHLYLPKSDEAPEADGKRDAAALEILRQHRDFDLVLSDIVMPGMSGLELGRRVRHNLGAAIVLATGYSDKASEALQEGFALLHKPYSLEALRAILGQTLKRPASV